MIIGSQVMDITSTQMNKKQDFSELCPSLAFQWHAYKGFKHDIPWLITMGQWMAPR